MSASPTADRLALTEQLKALGVTRKSRPGRALLRAVDLGYITELRCAMPVCERGEDRRGEFEPYTRPLPDWMWSAEHKIPQRLGGKLTADNVMLAHRACNREDFAKIVRKGKRRPLTP